MSNWLKTSLSTILKLNLNAIFYCVILKNYIIGIKVEAGKI